MVSRKNNIQALREYLGLSQEEFAEYLIVSRVFVSTLENDRRAMSSVTQSKLDGLELAVLRFHARKNQVPITQDPPNHALEKAAFSRLEIASLNKAIKSCKTNIRELNDEVLFLKRRMDIFRDITIDKTVGKIDSGIMRKWIQWQMAKDKIRLRDTDPTAILKLEAKIEGFKAEIRYHKKLLRLAQV
jgi:transcriptional regulator with XRE-family HTH domain